MCLPCLGERFDLLIGQVIYTVFSYLDGDVAEDVVLLLPDEEAYEYERLRVRFGDYRKKEREVSWR